MTDRLLCYHKQPTSARTRFLVLEGGSVLSPEPLPDLASLTGDVDPAPEAASPLIADMADRLGLPTGSLVVDREEDIACSVDIPDGPATIHIARFTTQDPPIKEAETLGGKFIELTQARRLLPDVELELLRRVYQISLG
ncbi:MAG: hypothetical protein ACPGOV_16910 [Magnetovibrionaceae bacterium]